MEVEQSLIQQLRQAIKDGIDYLQSVLTLFQVRATELALSSVLFIFLLGAAALLLITTFIVLNVALGFWLRETTGSATCTLLILGSVYGVLSLITGGVAIKWLKQLGS